MMTSVLTEKGKSMTEKEIEEITQRFILFMKAQEEAETRGEREFACPLCGGKAWWGRSAYNHHLHGGCRKCGLKVME